MPRTPDRFPGVREDEAIVLDDTQLSATEGEMRYDSGRFTFYDSIGEYDPRSVGGALPPANQVSEVLFSKDGSTFTVELPVVSCGGWLVNNEGDLIVVG